VQRRTIEATRPGVTAKELFDTATQAYRDLGIGTRVMVGHSIGLVIHERPLLAPGETWTVEEGMVMCIENGSTGATYDHNERYMTEDMIVVTKYGCELLSDYGSTEELLVIE
jgi:Xaa-Pro aminopeptidase